MLHLKSGVVALDADRLLCVEALAGHETFADMQLLRVTAGEEYLANCVRVKNVILVAEGDPGTRSRLCMRP